MTGFRPVCVTPSITRVLRRIDTTDLSVCWLWPGAVNGDGYGVVCRLGGGIEMVHRVVYEHFVGVIPEGLVIDHLCRVVACCNYLHLEPVPQRTNVLRGNGLPARHAVKTECIRGHEFTPENTYYNHKGHRHCRACARDRQRQRRAAA